MRILILYHSGVGSTKLIAELIQKKLADSFSGNQVDIFSVEDEIENLDYDLFIIGFPTYHASPSTSITNYLERINKFKDEKAAFIFTTCGLYPENTLRIFSKMCLEKNLIPIHTASYRSPASDGTLLFPNLKFLQRFAKNVEDRVNADVELFLKKRINDYKMPRFKAYSIVNYLNKKAGESYKPTIYLNKNRCINCSKCVRSCPHTCFELAKDGYPIYSKGNCEHCYRCIHLCPKQALSIKKNKAPQKQLRVKSINDTIKQ